MLSNQIISIEVLQFAKEIEEIFSQVDSINELDFSYIREENKDILFSQEQREILNNYDLDELSKNILAETKGDKKLSYFTSNVRKEDRKIVYTALLKKTNHGIKVSNFTPLEIFAYKPICPICSHENKLVYKIDKESVVCESCNHLTAWNKLCNCDSCNQKWNDLQLKLEEFFTLYGIEYSLINSIGGYKDLYKINSKDDVKSFLDLYKKSFSNNCNDDFIVGRAFNVIVKEKEQVNDYDYFINLYHRTFIVTKEIVSEEFKEIIISIDEENDLLIKFNTSGKFISQEIRRK